jgi:hypothetical protein
MTRALATALAVLAVVPSSEPTEKILCGPLTMEIHVSRTAHIFHVVDQLSAWSEFCHDQYRRAMPLDSADLAALARHREIRGERSWGGGLEQAFYTDLPLEEALRAGIEAGHLTEKEATTEKEVFSRFEVRVDALLKSQREGLRKSLASLDREAVTRMAKSLSRLFGVDAVTIPVYLLASPPPGGGGGLNGGRLTLELCPGEDPAPTLVHEVVHGFIEARRTVLEQSVSGTPGLDFQTLNEGIAYAVMPGLFGAEKEDRLARTVARDLAAGRRMDDSYVRFNRYGLALRPIVKEALEKGNLESLLIQARAVWLGLREIETAPSGPKIRSAGPGWEALTRRMDLLRPGVDLVTFNHNAEHYGQFAAGLRKGDLFILLFAGDHEDRQFPKGYEDLLPIPLVEVWKAVGEGKSVEREGKARGFRVVLLAAPKEAELVRLIEGTKLLVE